MGLRLLDLPVEILLKICSSIGYRDFSRLGRVCRVFLGLSQDRGVFVAALFDLSHTRPIPFAFPGPYTKERILSRPIEELRNAFIHAYKLERAFSQSSITPRIVIHHTDLLVEEIRWVTYINDRYCMIMTEAGVYSCFVVCGTGDWSELSWAFRDWPNCWHFDHDAGGVTAIINTDGQQQHSISIFRILDEASNPILTRIMHLPIAAGPSANFLEGDFAGCVYRLPDRSIHVVVIEWRCCKTLVIDTGSSARRGRIFARTNAITQELWLHTESHTVGHTWVYSYSQLQSVFDSTKKGGIEHMRLEPQQTYKIIYQEDGMPPTPHRFTTRTLWDGSRAAFTHKPAWGTTLALLSDGDTKLKEGNSELTIRRDVLLRGHRMVANTITEPDVYSIGPFGKSMTVLMDDGICDVPSVWLVDFPGGRGEVTERMVRVDAGVERGIMCMDFDDARGILTIANREGMIHHIYLV